MHKSRYTLRKLVFFTVMNKSILISSIAAVVGTSAVVAAPAKAAGFIDGSTLGIAGSVDAEPLGAFLDGQPIVSYDFNPLDTGSPTDDNGLGDFNILQENTGTFAEFNPLPVYFGQIQDLPNPIVDLPTDNFLQFASASAVDPTAFDTFFDLEEITSIQYNFTGTGLTNSVGVIGEFSRDGHVATAEGTFSADLSFDTFADEINQQLGLTGDQAIDVDEDVVIAVLTEDLASFNDLTGQSITQAELDSLVFSDIRYSADFVVEADVDVVVPEASNVAGLVGLGLAGALALRKRKQASTNH